jgi:DNA polymerase III subunit delta
MKPAELRHQIREGRILPAYLFLGSQDLLKAEAVEALRRAAGPGAARSFTAGAADAATILEARQNQSLFDPAAVIVVRQAAKLRGDTAALSAALRARSKEPPVVFWDETVDRRTAFWKAIAEAGGEVEFETQRQDAKAWVRAEAQRLGHAIDAGAVEALVEELVGDDLLRLRSTLERISVGVGPGAAIDEEAVALHVASSRSHAIFELQDAIYARDVRTTVRLYRRLLDEGEEVPGLVGVVFAAVRRLLLAREAPQERHRLEVSPKRAETIVRSARAFSSGSLRRAIDRLADIDVESKTGRGDARAALEQWLIALTGGEPRAGNVARG